MSSLWYKQFSSRIRSTILKFDEFTIEELKELLKAIEQMIWMKGRVK